MRLAAMLSLLLAWPLTAQEVKPYDADELKKQPIATGNSEVAKLLRQWWDEGTAAGNVSDFYDNRDGDHSPLDLKPYPQLQKIHYTPEMIKQRVHWAAQPKVLPHVVFGNSSTSAPPRMGGSNPRHYYVSTKGLELLAQHYAKNNLYIYPEHRDHDPGRNGKGEGKEEGYGDLYPTNTPYLIISQGSSGSDQPFMRALPHVLAAFRPDVKKKLIESGLLMPTLQMIFRSSNKHLKGADEYLTSKAHPSVFEGAWVDPRKMVLLAHDLTLDTIPPLVQLKATEEEQPQQGVDYFDLVKTEKLADTPAVIARVFRGKERWRKLVVSAAGSQDLQKRPLKYEWRLLRGDPERVKIRPRDLTASEVEIQVAHPERRPIAPGSKMESSRVDIGVFVNNGKNWSAPGFVTFCSLEHEQRKYDEKDRIAEIAYDPDNYVDFRLSLPRQWRDVYQYDAKGLFIGWVRHQPDRKEPAHFTADGHLIEQRDEQGRCRQARLVQYTAEGQAKTPQNLRLRWAVLGEPLLYEYQGPEDRRGRVKK